MPQQGNPDYRRMTAADMGPVKGRYLAEQRRDLANKQVGNYVGQVKALNNYTRAGQVDPDVRKYQRSYYRGDQGMRPSPPRESNPGDEELQHLYDTMGKYQGYGTAALGGMNGAYPNQGKISAAMQVKNTKPGQ
jgi:hypothetical protein